MMKMKTPMKRTRSPQPVCHRCRGKESEFIQQPLLIGLLGAPPEYQHTLNGLTANLGLPWRIASYALNPEGLPTMIQDTTPPLPYSNTPPFQPPQSPPPRLILLVDNPSPPPSPPVPELILQLKLSHPQLPILLHSPTPDTTTLVRALAAGVNGWLRQPPPPAEFQCAICTTLRIGYWLSQEAQGLLLASLHRLLAFETGPLHLTDREREIIRHLAEGKQRGDLGKALGNLSKNTVHAHLEKLMSKLEVRHWREIVPQYLRRCV
jgi:DNA-binding NarL/FixJ family response regulator